MAVGFFYTCLRVLDATKPPAVTVLNEAVSVAEQSEVVTSAVQIGHSRGVNPDQTLSIYSCLFDFGLTNSFISDSRSDTLT